MPSVLALHALVTSLGVSLGVLFPFLSVILADRGFDPSEIGLIMSAGAVAFTVAIPMWGHLADVRFGRPRTLQLCAIGSAAAVIWLVFPVPWWLVIVLLLVWWIFESALQPLSDAITVTTLRGRDYGRVRLFTSLGFAVGVVASGFLYDRTGYAPAFVLFAVGAAVMVVATSFLPDIGRADLAAHRRQASAGASSARPGREHRTWRFGSAGVALRIAPRLGVVLLASGLLHFGIISGFTYLPLRIEDLGGSPSDVALSAGLSAAVEIPSMLVLGVAAQRFGLRAVFTTSALLYMGALLSWTVIDVPLVLVATRAVTGVGFSGVVVGMVLTMATLLPDDLQATGQALFQTASFGVAAILANVIGGVLYQAAGPVTLFTLGAVLALAAAVVGWLSFPRRVGRGPAPVMRQSDA
jgi:MFS transporter, PPP family, 3-phenylpropionic acid transporter